MPATIPAYETYTSSSDPNPLQLPPELTSVVVENSAGTIVAATQYGYDNYASNPLTSVTAVQHDANYSTAMTARGNVTSVTHCLTLPTSSTGTCAVNSNPTVTYTYDITGQPVSMTDACSNGGGCSDVTGSTNHTTTFSFTDSPANGNSSPSGAWYGNSNAYLTNITYPSAGGKTLQKNFTYNYALGYLTSSIDENSNPTTYEYNDPMNRLTNVLLPNDPVEGQGYTEISYNDTPASSTNPGPTVTTTQLLNSNGTTKVTTKVFDGMEHVIQAQLNSDPNGTDTVYTTYDGEGHAYTVTNPQRATPSSSDGVTYHYYDALGRQVEEKEQDGSLLQWCYDGNPSTPAVSSSLCSATILGSVANGTYVDSMDENGNHWQHTSDVFGDLTEVMEPNGVTQSPTMETDYTYNVLKDLLSVAQWGGSHGSSNPVNRSFTYDPLSRLTSSLNPESGSITYTYDANGNLSQKVSPALNVSSGTQTTLYCYDALNRVTYQYTYNGSITCTNPPSFYDSIYAYDGNLISGSQFSGTTFVNALGHLTDAQELSWSTLMSERVPYQFDVMGRTESELQNPYTPFGSTYTFTSSYDAAGDLSSGSNTGTNITLSYVYDAAARLTNLTSSLTNSNGTTYPGTLYSVAAGGYGPVGLTQATYAGDPNNTGLFNLFRYYDNRDRVRDNEVYPSNTSTVNFGTATVTITGAAATGSGSVSIQAGSVTSSTTYATGQTATQIADALATGFDQNSNSVVTASVVTNATANGSGQGACTNGVVPGAGTPCAVVALKAIVLGVYGDVTLTLGGSGTSFTTAESGLALTGGEGTPQGSGSAYVYTLTRDRVGNITSSTDAYNGSFNYTYDTLNRLVSAGNTGYEGPGYVTTAGRVTNQCWSYESFGNRKYELDSSSACPSPLTQSTSTHYANYNASNRITGSDTQVNGPIYDAAGNVIQDALNNYLYDAKGRLCAVENILAGATTEYVYDADSRRVAKGNWAVTGWPAAGATWTGTIPSCATPTAANGGLLATYTQSGAASPALYFNFNDWLGTKRLEVNAAGQAVNYWGSDPFGDYLTPHVTTPDPTEHHFTGKERDAESGNDYFGARYYASSMARFLSPDWSSKAEPVPYAKLENPQSLNLYAYVLSNPLNTVDPLGHKGCKETLELCKAVLDAVTSGGSIQDGWASRLLKISRTISSGVETAEKTVAAAKKSLDTFNSVLGFGKANCAGGGSCSDAWAKRRAPSWLGSDPRERAKSRNWRR